MSYQNLRDCWLAPPNLEGNMATKNYDEPVDVRAAGLGKEYLTLVSRRQEWAAAKDEAERELKTINDELKAIQATSGYKTVLTPDWRVTLASGCNTSISRERLLEQGVSVKVIEKATKRTEYEYLTVTVNK